MMKLVSVHILSFRSFLILYFPLRRRVEREILSGLKRIWEGRDHKQQWILHGRPDNKCCILMLLVFSDKRAWNRKKKTGISWVRKNVPDVVKQTAEMDSGWSRSRLGLSLRKPFSLRPALLIGIFNRRCPVPSWQG